MSKKPRRESPPPATEFVAPPYVPNYRRPGDEGTAFRQAVPAEPKAERQLLTLLGTNFAMVLMGGLLVVVVVALLVILVVRL